MQRRLVALAALSLVAIEPRTAAGDQVSRSAFGLATPFASLTADPAPAWVFFADKDPGADLDRALDERGRALSSRALARRQRMRGDRGVDVRDLDVAPDRVASLRATGARVRVVSRWLNAASVVADAAQLEAISALPEVVRTQPVARRARAPRGLHGGVPATPLGDDLAMYGVAAEQLSQIEVPAMHECGLTGAGVVVAVLDSGFLLTHEAFATLDVIAQHDFIHEDDVTENEPNDPPGQHDHGTSVLSLLAGRAPGSFMGVAPDISVILAKTEDVSFEQPIEEDWFVAGLEWAESLGADLATASLGYIDWYAPSDLDGQTAVTSIAAGIAMDNGLVMVAAAGNWGPAPTTVSAPADADRLIAVGAVDLFGNVTDFSSRGPTADGRIKPDVSAMGQDDWVVVPGTPDGYTQGNGTSYAAPLVAGVAALLKQAYPSLGPVEMHALLTTTATQSAAPNNDIGWGIVRGYQAAGLYCTCIDADDDGFFDVACGGDDCDDALEQVNPAAIEACNGRDDDCDGMLARGEEDADADGSLACDGDCDDASAAVHPGAAESCDDGVDGDCDGATDEDDPDCAEPPPPPPPDDGPTPAKSAPGPVEGSCGCRVGDDRSSGAAIAFALLALVARARRRRGRSVSGGVTS